MITLRDYGLLSEVPVGLSIEGKRIFIKYIYSTALGQMEKIIVNVFVMDLHFYSSVDFFKKFVSLVNLF